MDSRKLYRALGTVAIVAVIATASALVFAIYFTQSELDWGVFVTGVLVASVLAAVAQASGARFPASTHSSKLLLAERELTRLTRELDSLSEAHASARARLQFADEDLPLMLAYVDSTRRCRYHNAAFAAFVRLPPQKVDGQNLRDVLGHAFYSEIEDVVEQVLAGTASYSERTRRMPDGAVYHLLTLYQPCFGSDGKVAGFYAVLTDITRPDHLSSGTPSSVSKVDEPERASSSGDTEPASAQDRFSDSLAEEITGWTDAVERIVAAIEKDEFTLYCQIIKPLAIDSDEPPHREILVRLLEEETNLVPPGAFFPLAEKHGLMPRLDRWVLARVLQWISETGDAGKKGGKCFINLAGATLSDPDYAQFVQQQLRKFGVPGSAICFELTVPEVASRRGDAAAFARLMKQYGCQIALSGYGGDHLSLDVLKHVSADFLKIDGGIILGVLREPVHSAKVVAIGRMAKTIGIRTIGELVEDEATMARLQAANIDFAQGYGVSRPEPLAGPRMAA